MHRSKALKALWLTGVVFVASLSMLFVGIGTASATTSMTPLLTPLQTSITAGGTAGFHATLTDDANSSTVSHIVFTITASISTPDGPASATYVAHAVSGAGATCKGSGGSLVCTAKQMKPGQTIAVDVAFSTPATLTTPATITANAVATVSAQTNGSDTTQGTSTWTADPASTSIGAASDLSVTTFALPNQKITTGNSLRSQLQLPKSFLNAYFGLVTVATQTTGAASCTKCPTAYLSLSIQDSTIPAGPFSATNPFALVLTLASSEQPNGYQFSGITHDGVEIPPCATSPLDADTPMCLDSWSQRRPGADIVATVLGYQNGFIGFD